MAQPETDLEYLFYGDSDFILNRLTSLDLLSDEGLSNIPKLKKLIEEVTAKYRARMPYLGPSYVHEIARKMIGMGAINGYGLYLHATGPRGQITRQIDEKYMKWIGEEEKCKEIQEWWFDEDNPRDGNDDKSGLEI